MLMRAAARARFSSDVSRVVRHGDDGLHLNGHDSMIEIRAVER
jgi:hypothetical protein